MANNQLLTHSMITREALRVLKNKIVFAKNVNRQYEPEFGKKGMKIGDTLNIRKPNRYITKDGPVFSGQDTVEESTPLTINHHKHIGMDFSERDMTLSMDDFSKRIIDPAVTQLANTVDLIGLQEMYKKVYSFQGAPSATLLPNDLNSFTYAMAKIASLGGNTDNLIAAVDPMTQASLVNGLKGLFQSSEQISDQYEKGTMGIAAGSTFKMTQNIPKHTIGALGGAGALNGATLEGATQVVTDGWSNGVTGLLKKGDIVSFAGVYSVNPQSYESTGLLAEFVVTADVNSDGSGNATIPLDRAIYASALTPKKNVTALPADGAAVTVFGDDADYAGVTAPQNLVYHKDAFTLACVDFVQPEAGSGVVMSRASDPDSGLSLTLTKGFDVYNFRQITRLDIMFGWACNYPEYACRVVGRSAA